MSRQQHMDTLDQRRLRLADSAERLAGKAQNLKGQLVKEAKVAAGRAKSDTQTSLRELGADAKHVAEGAKNDTQNMARERVRAAAQHTAQTVNPKHIAKENPLLAFLGALTAGYVFARMMPAHRSSAGAAGELGIGANDVP